MEDRDSERLEGLIAEFVRRRDAHGETVEAFLREHGEREPALRPALQALARTEALFLGVPDRPAQVGSYLVLDDLGRGGMGRVFRVEPRERPGERLALKLLHLSLEHEPRARERFQREAEALRRVEHPGIVRVVDQGFVEGRPYLVMELVEGRSLAEWTAGARSDAPASAELPGTGPRDRRAAAIVARVARSVAAAHRAGVLHRDLTPRNVLLRPDGSPVVIDFGLVHVRDASTLTASGDLLGTPAYMAPEQARGEETDERTDVFALGGLLFELVTGEAPRPSGSALESLRSAGSRPVPQLLRRLGRVPRPLAAILERALAFRPSWRYASADALAQDLERYLSGEPVPAPRLRWLHRAHGFCVGHERALVVASIGLALALVGLGWWRVRAASDAEVARIALGETLVAWLDGDATSARASAQRHAEHSSDDDFDRFVEALVTGGALPDASEPGLGNLVAGEEARRAGRDAEAARLFDAAWNVRPDRYVARVLHALAALDMGDREHARDAVESVARPLAASRFVHRTLAELYAGERRFEDVRRASDAALALDPENLELHALRTWASLELGDAAGAQRAARAAQDIDGDGALAAFAALQAPASDGTSATLAARLEREGLWP